MLSRSSIPIISTFKGKTCCDALRKLESASIDRHEEGSKRFLSTVHRANPNKKSRYTCFKTLDSNMVRCQIIAYLETSLILTSCFPIRIGNEAIVNDSMGQVCLRRKQGMDNRTHLLCCRCKHTLAFADLIMKYSANLDKKMLLLLLYKNFTAFHSGH